MHRMVGRQELHRLDLERRHRLGHVRVVGDDQLSVAAGEVAVMAAVRVGAGVPDPGGDPDQRAAVDRGLGREPAAPQFEPGDPLGGRRAARGGVLADPVAGGQVVRPPATGRLPVRRFHVRQRDPEVGERVGPEAGGLRVVVDHVLVDEDLPLRVRAEAGRDQRLDRARVRREPAEQQRPGVDDELRRGGIQHGASVDVSPTDATGGPVGGTTTESRHSVPAIRAEYDPIRTLPTPIHLKCIILSAGFFLADRAKVAPERTT
ncbi:hypothetical protein GCM10027186_11420 [Micromonospora schwarzwaldensis]